MQIKALKTKEIVVVQTYAQGLSILDAEDLVILNKIEFGVGLDGPLALKILAALQLAVWHPKMPDEVRASIAAFGAVLQEQLSETTNLALLCRAGWDRPMAISEDDPEKRGRPT
jgi:hypothetical protein